MDFNNHVNNKSYINIAEASIPDEYKKTHSLRKINIRFIRESFLGDNLVCSTYKTESDDTFIHKITNNETSVCDIKTQWKEKIITDKILNYPLDVKSEE